MLSRVQEIGQLFILEELPTEKIYANYSALQEIDRLVSVSKNKNPSKWEDDNSSRIRISFLNCRSMRNKFENIKADKSLLNSDLIILTETWIEPDQDTTNFDLLEYKSNFNNGGRGKGIVSYFNDRFTHTANIVKDGFSVSKISSENIDVVGVYRSQVGNIKDLTETLESLIDNTKITIIGGDLNICFLKKPNNIVTKALKERGFDQGVKIATHIEGGLLDHVYINCPENENFDWDIEVFPKYYSDHDGIGLTLWENSE